MDYPRSGGCSDGRQSELPMNPLGGTSTKSCCIFPIALASTPGLTAKITRLLSTVLGHREDSSLALLGDRLSNLARSSHNRKQPSGDGR